MGDIGKKLTEIELEPLDAPAEAPVEMPAEAPAEEPVPA